MCMGGLDWDDLAEKEAAAKHGGQLPKASELPPLKVLSWCMRALPPGGKVPAEGEDAARHERLCEAIAASGAHVVCLQGYEGLEAQWLVQLYAQRLHELGFDVDSMAHLPHSPDGVAVLWRRDSVRVSLRGEMRAHGAPNERAALLLVLRDARASEYGPRLAVVCTQLGPVPGQEPGRGRGQQLREVLEAMTSNLAHIAGVPVLFCANLGGPLDDELDSRMQDFGFLHVWQMVHKRPCRVTHTDESGNSCAADHVWLRGRFDPEAVALLPESVPDDEKLCRPAAGAAAGASASSPEYWGELSDHRPMLGTFRWPEGS